MARTLLTSLSLVALLAAQPALAQVKAAIHPDPIVDTISLPNTGSEPVDGDKDIKGAITVPGVKKTANVHYGPDAMQTIDIYAPGNVRGLAPMIIMVHGGGWFIGDKENSGVITNKGNHFVGKGFVFASVNYSMKPVDALKETDQVANAIVFLQKNATKYGANPRQIVVIGHSAGAHIVSLISANPTRVTGAGGTRWAGTISLDSAAMNVPQAMQKDHYKFYDAAFGTDPKYWVAASPIDQLGRNAIPFFLACSTQRTDSCPPNVDFSNKVKRLGGTSSVTGLDLTHGEIDDFLGLPGDYTNKVDAFVTKALADFK